MEVLEAVPEAACITGIIYPIGVLHLAGQPLPEDVRQVLSDDIAHSLNRYFHSGTYRNRAMRLRKWINTGARIQDLPRVWQGGDTAEALVFKEPFLSLAPEFVYDALPDARFVYIVRDGRDCAASLVKSYDALSDEKLRHRLSTEARIGRPYDDRIVPWWVEESEEDAFMAASPYARSAWMWRYMVQRCDAFFKQPEVQADGRVLQIRYEQLMQDPLREGERVAHHFRLRLSPEARRRLKSAHTGSIGNFKRWNEAEVAEAEVLHGEALRQLGYIGPEQQLERPTGYAA